MLNHHVALGRFLTDGVIPIDNGPAERLHVRCAIARLPVRWKARRDAATSAQ